MSRILEEKIVKTLLFITAITAVFSVLLIGVFIFIEGLPIFFKYGIVDVLFGTVWNPTNQVYGIWPMIVGTIYVTFVAILIGAPMGVGVAVYLVEIAHQRISRIIIPAVELLAGIPSVVYGLFGMFAVRGVISSLERGPLAEYLPANYQTGYSILTAAIILAVMILPTIINISLDALKAVPREYKEGSLALGVSHWQTIYKVLVPAAKSGIITAVILGVGRALGETMAVIMVIGNTPLVPAMDWTGLFAPARSMTANIALEMGYAGPEHQQALFATGIVLFMFIIVLNSVTTLLVRRKARK
ncbi:phosphate ABC transporter permease subunit PstC [Paenibacillus agaridevorans]|uniref:Phosphate transport system permease protein n=1 Tax=Paenibacillus agaridevorans TaxID=171404 RepID=A0A2R5ENR1_9BACL|nr:MULTISPECIES: phosphate ABC transporter permease subunit PstC [Paenibacillus]GBG07745.1 phosphate ABC transporter permease subunit PstC [Paenibacillus agaridevorans]